MRPDFLSTLNKSFLKIQIHLWPLLANRSYFILLPVADSRPGTTWRIERDTHLYFTALQECTSWENTNHTLKQEPQQWKTIFVPHLEQLATPFQLWNHDSNLIQEHVCLAWDYAYLCVVLCVYTEFMSAAATSPGSYFMVGKIWNRRDLGSSKDLVHLCVLKYLLHWHLYLCGSKMWICSDPTNIRIKPTTESLFSPLGNQWD